MGKSGRLRVAVVLAAALVLVGCVRLFQRAGTNHWATYRWDPEADAPDGLNGNFVLASRFRFDDILCGSPFGGPQPCGSTTPTPTLE